MLTRPQWGVIAAGLLTVVLVLFIFAGRSRVPTPPALNLSSPESSVKSYWTLREWLRRQVEPGKAANGAQPNIAEVMSAVTAGGARESFESRPGMRDPLAWSLKRIDQTADDRAVAVATIRNLSHEPATITPTPIELFQADTSTEFHYVLSRQGDGWRVVEVWRVDGEKRQRVR